MGTTAIGVPNVTNPQVVREYDIRGTKYIVRATVKDGASEDAVEKVRRLIRNEMSRNVESLNNMADKDREKCYNDMVLTDCLTAGNGG